MSDSSAQPGELIAAVDLGSNSFHMVIAREFHGEFRTLERRGQKVQLAAGLDDEFMLSEEAQQRGLDCLREFGQHLQGMDSTRVTVLATNALRAARNRQDFIDRAEAVLGYPIEVIAGREEARLIYLGVAHTLADDVGNRLVVDIGGGSTEFIIGERFEPKALESLHMGCVSFTRRFFADGQITEAAFERAVAAARQELLHIETDYKHLGWQNVVGSSGTIRAVEQSVVEFGWSTEGITRQALKKLRKQTLQFETLDDVVLPGVKVERRQVFIGGLAILTAVFDTFDIEHMVYSDGALREGALWDLFGRSSHEDVRQRTVRSLQERFYIDEAQSARVSDMARALFLQVYQDLGLEESQVRWLLWGAELHEIGLSLSHSGFHKHGAYLLQHADMLGFTRQGQAKLAALVRCHRRKFNLGEFATLSPESRAFVIQLTRLLRIAVILNHGRGAHPVPVPELKVIAGDHDSLSLTLPAGWLAGHSLTAGDLMAEVDYQKAAGMALTVE
ncbi:exopolyphosphatase [Oceanobacter sp. 4_MG-2023]|uniref:exopolyphosphatase n=1 Tax=Oceanobacter sp. 4_MG-2023 TaxID=3062623 RepID=UPI00273487F8|nr:exopolyphosphatase [Oceanobacter sp. 4_MG-2023]MDP2546844.1 exopolyphosphatase [Oceanobacter sp. 4_MG-2023]